jgi:hypothetical protein
VQGLRDLYPEGKAMGYTGFKHAGDGNGDGSVII